MNHSVLVIAGEVSGDQRAAEVVRAVHARRPDVQFWGIGGPEMRAAGVETLHDIREMAVMGLVEVLRRYGFFRRVFHEMLDAAKARRPDAVLLVDYPGFNLRFATHMKRRGIKVIYYICPQVWAWHRSRIPKMARIVDRLLAIFPFEPQVFADTNLKVDFVIRWWTWPKPCAPRHNKNCRGRVRRASPCCPAAGGRKLSASCLLSGRLPGLFSRPCLMRVFSSPRHQRASPRWCARGWRA